MTTTRSNFTPATAVSLRCVASILGGVGLALTIGCGAGSNATPAPGTAGTTAQEAATQETADQEPAVVLRTAIETRDWQLALRVGQQALIANPGDPDVLTNLAVATAQSGDRVAAAKLLVEAAEATGYEPGNRIDNAIRALLDVGHLYDSIELLEAVVERHPEAAPYRRMLVGFLGEAQLTDQIEPHITQLIRQRQFDLPLLLVTTDMNSRRFASDSIEALVSRNPQDLRPRLGAARYALDRRDPKRAESVLREILASHPDFAPAHAMLGVTLVTLGKSDELPNWYSGLPEGCNELTGYWVTLGAWALERGHTASAVRALGEATRRSPNDSAMWARLAAAIRTLDASETDVDLGDIDLEEISVAIDQRREDLLELRDRLSGVTPANRSQSVAVEIAKKLIDLGRNWEAEAWLAVATQLPDMPSPEVTPLRQEATRRLSRNRDWQSRDGHPELAFDLDRFSAPTSSMLGASGNAAASDRASGPPLEIRMEERSRSYGLNFYGRVGPGATGPLVPIAQTLGCGGGVIDLDHDGRHDLVFAAAGGSLRGDDSDRGAMFRNRGTTFEDVSKNSGFGDGGFGHGIAVGDYNDDGFQDLLVLNLGINRLYRNNGDGTFSDVSELLPEQGRGQWSTSAAIADVDGDGYNDIVIVNYCDADQPLEEPCFGSDGKEVNCYPMRYRAARDTVLLGKPDGGFSDVSSKWLNEVTAGRGLGVIVGRLDGQKQCVYVANDASPNHYYQQRDQLGLIETAVATGVAVDAQSLDQGSMGVATADVDNDGDLDIYVTGFADEYNIFYEQQAPGFWSDRTAARGLVEPTLKVVGFGAEAVDLDNDGWVELLITNGHIGRPPGDTTPFAQPMQVFRQATKGQFDLVDISPWGEYFDNPHIGRCLFTCDVNFDGRLDAVITHATEPVALLINQSESRYHRIGFRLADRQTRDAVGAIVEFDLGEGPNVQHRTLHRLAGSGYLCSNQVELLAGTGNMTVARNVRVTWPDGEIERLGDLECDAEYLVVRGEMPHRLDAFRD